MKDLNSASLKVEDFLESISINDGDEKKVFYFKDFIFDNKSGIWITNNETNISSTINVFFLDELKCINIEIKNSNLDLDINYKRLNKFFMISLLLNDTARIINKGLLFYLRTDNFFDFVWNKNYPKDFHNVFYTAIESKFKDDYIYLKNFFSNIKHLLGFEVIKNVNDYNINLINCFMNEQFSGTTMVPLSLKQIYAYENILIKNKQFNNFILFRTLATNKNDYDFTANTPRFAFLQNVYPEKNFKDKNTLILSFSSSSLQFEETFINRYHFIKLFLHLCVLASFYFEIDILTLPLSLKKAFPLFKYFTVYFIYYIVCFMIFSFECWFRFVRFLDFKND